METGKGLEPHRQAAQEAISEAARLPFARIHFRAAARSLPKVLRRHGLGQTLVYLQVRAGTRGPSPYDVLARHLDRWLLAAMGASGRTALAALAARDSRYYREASEQAWRFLRTLNTALEEPS